MSRLNEINCFPYCGPRDKNNKICKSCKPYFSTLEKKVQELEENELRFPTLSEFSNLQEDNEKLQCKIKELEAELKLNATMLAKQCDLAREAENKTKNNGRR